MSYISELEKIGTISLDNIISMAKRFVPAAYRFAPWAYPGLEHGTARLENEEQLCCYLASYGEMHKGKLQQILHDFNVKNLDENLEIIDWGCGQGIASVAVVDFLRSHGIIEKLQKVTLVEPSAAAIERAKFNVKLATDDNVYIETINCFLPSTTGNVNAIGGLHIEEKICLHLFSNILDIKEIDLKELANLVSSTGYRHYFFCVGPMNANNDRIEAFCKYFQLDNQDIFSNVRAAQYAQIANGKWYSCVTKGFQIVRAEGKPILVPLSYYPSKQFFAAYRLDAIEQMDNSQKKESFWNIASAFEVLAPFDIGASIYDDIDPILAVLNNIITRGLPTKCSPFVTEKLEEEFLFCEKLNKYGTFSYPTNDYNRLTKYQEQLRNIPIAVARMEKTIVEAVLTGHISIDKEEWNVLVKENDVPCAALAFEELKMMYNHLTQMSAEYCSRKFPHVNLTILSADYANSTLHLNNKVYSYSKQINRELEYDLVVDFAIEQYVDEENVQFSEFRAKNNCYFNVRSSSKIWSNRVIYTTDSIQYKPVTRLGQSGEHVVEEDQASHLRYFLNLIFRKQDFRPGQLPILNRALQNKGVIGLLPTGGGKSLTYQLAAMLQPGVTVVIDPLKSLMEDQYDGLRATGIDSCAYTNSELSYEERAENEARMENSQVTFMFMSPERLCIYEFRERLANMHDLHVYFAYGVIDEVHCVSEWGQDFRFSYLHLGRNLYSYVKAKNRPISLFGLTATASFDVLSDVERELSGNGAFSLDPDTIVRYENSNRLELQYKIERIEIDYEVDEKYDPTQKLSQFGQAVRIGDKWGAFKLKAKFLEDYIHRVPKYLMELQQEDAINNILLRFQDRENLENLDKSSLFIEMPTNYLAYGNNYEHSGIVFCPHVNKTGISVQYNAEKIRTSCEVGTFAGSAIEGETMGNESMENMRLFRDNKMPLMIATKAFGMGIDKPNVRFTVNMNYSSSLESFVQEAGRAGRDRKMALSVILMSDYNLVRINSGCPSNSFPMSIIKNKWFKEQDLKEIIEAHNLNIEERYIDRCDPLSDIVRVKCNTDNVTDEGKPASWQCQGCSKYRDCTLRHVDWSHRIWMYRKDLELYLNYNKIRIPKECIEFQNPDYGTVMYFFDNNFKGESVEKKKMHELLSVKPIEFFIGNDRKDKPTERKTVNGFMETLLNADVGTEVVSLVSYDDECYSDIAKAIYRMCIIGLIDDFTQDYSTRKFRILSTRKKNGSYYNRLKDFLMRYYPEDRAENEVEKASVHAGHNEVHKCLGYLTEFIYDKIALKRKRAIDDMRHFCLIGIDQTKDWKEINEDLKDEIYFYFNSKFAREGYKTDKDEPFSLLDDTQRGQVSDFWIVEKYQRVVDNDVIGVSGSPKDNIKHLHGAVRLIRRSETEVNPALCLLNTFCLLALKVGSNKNMMQQLKDSYVEGYKRFREQSIDLNDFYANIEKFKVGLRSKGRNIASEEDIAMLNDLEQQAELEIHSSWLKNFSINYVN